VQDVDPCHAIDRDISSSLQTGSELDTDAVRSDESRAANRMGEIGILSRRHDVFRIQGHDMQTFGSWFLDRFVNHLADDWSRCRGDGEAKYFDDFQKKFSLPFGHHYWLRLPDGCPKSSKSVIQMQSSLPVLSVRADHSPFANVPPLISTRRVSTPS
jgi:hypothetical protein